MAKSPNQKEDITEQDEKEKANYILPTDIHIIYQDINILKENNWKVICHTNTNK